MLEHYHNINSVCSAKVRIALAEKSLEVTEHLLTLRGDQHDPAYRKLNPNGVVPTLVHDGKPIIESLLILYYLDETFPEVPLMPSDPALRHRVRSYNKLIDEYVHNSCMILTFATAFRPNLSTRPRSSVPSISAASSNTSSIRNLSAKRSRSTGNCCRGWPRRCKAGAILPAMIFPMPTAR
jgi:glutathione S-transferase